MPYDGVAVDKECQDLTALYGGLDKTINFFTEHPDRWMQNKLWIDPAAPEKGGCAVGLLCHFLGVNENAPGYGRLNTLCSRATGVSFDAIIRHNDNQFTNHTVVCQFLKTVKDRVANAISNGLLSVKTDHVGEFAASFHVIDDVAHTVVPVDVTKWWSYAHHSWQFFPYTPSNQKEATKLPSFTPVKEYAST